MVGTSGRVGQRLAPVTAIGRKRLLRISGIAPAMPAKASSVSPAEVATIAAGEPLYGTCRMLALAMYLKSSPAICVALARPDDAKLSLPGCARAAAMMSPRLRNWLLVGTTTILGPAVSCET